MKLKNLLLCATLPIFLIACSAEPLPANKMDYVGHWESQDSRVQMNISPQGRIEYSNEQPNKSSQLSAAITKFEGDNFKAGVGPFTTEFKVSQPPQQDHQGNWFIVVDGYTLAKTK